MSKKERAPEGLYFGHAVLGATWCFFVGATNWLTFTLAMILQFFFVFLLFAQTVALIVTHDKIRQNRKNEGTLPQRSTFRKICNMALRILVAVFAAFTIIIPNVNPFIKGLIYTVCYACFCYLWCQTIIPKKERKVK